MGLVDGFAKGIQIADGVHRTRLMENQQKLENKYKAENMDFQRWQRTEAKLKKADVKNQRAAAGWAYTLDKGIPPSQKQMQWAHDHPDLLDPTSLSLLQDTTGEKARANDILARAMKDPKSVPLADSLWAINVSYDGQIGEGKKIVGAYPSPDNTGMVFEIAGDGIDGTKPMTKYRMTEADGDNEVKVVRFADLAKDISTKNTLIQGLNQYRISLGDNSPIESEAAINALKAKYAREDSIAKQKASAATELEKLKQKQRIELEGIKSGYKKSGSKRSEEIRKLFDKQLTELDSLQKARANALSGFNDFGIAIEGEQQNEQVAALERAIADKERYMQQTSPELWFQYRGKHVDIPGAGLSGGAVGDKTNSPVTKQAVLDELQGIRLAEKSSMEEAVAYLEDLKKTNPDLFLAVMNQKKGLAQMVDRAQRSADLTKKNDTKKRATMEARLKELKRRLNSPMIVDKESIRQEIVKLTELLGS